MAHTTRKRWFGAGRSATLRGTSGLRWRNKPSFSAPGLAYETLRSQSPPKCPAQWQWRCGRSVFPLWTLCKWIVLGFSRRILVRIARAKWVSMVLVTFDSPPANQREAFSCEKGRIEASSARLSAGKQHLTGGYTSCNP